jgi:hypothetical protein
MVAQAPRTAATLEWIRPPGQKRSQRGREVILDAGRVLANPAVAKGAA